MISDRTWWKQQGISPNKQAIEKQVGYHHTFLFIYLINAHYTAPSYLKFN